MIKFGSEEALYKAECWDMAQDMLPHALKIIEHRYKAKGDISKALKSLVTMLGLNVEVALVADPGKKSPTKKGSIRHRVFKVLNNLVDVAIDTKSVIDEKFDDREEVRVYIEDEFNIDCELEVDSTNCYSWETIQDIIDYVESIEGT